MSQAMQVLTSMPQPVPNPAASAPQAAESADSAASFEQALAGELEGVAPAAEAPEPQVPETATADEPAALPAGFAAAGNLLPPGLPPEAAMLVATLLPRNVPAAAEPTADVIAPESLTVSDDATVAPDTTSLPATVLPTLPTEPVATTPPGHDAGAPVGRLDARSLPAASPTPSPAAPASATATAGADPAVSSTGPDGMPETPFTEALRMTQTDTAPRVRVEAQPALTAAASLEPSAVAANPMTPTPATVSASPAAANARIDVPLAHPGWVQAFGNQVVWATGQGLSAAELHLTPPELGPVSVRISLDQDQASIAFSTPHGVVRDAIEAALPRLRDMLGSQGIALADVNVSQRDSSQAQAEPGAGWGPGTGRGADGEVAEAVLPARRATVGMLDVYA